MFDSSGNQFSTGSASASLPSSMKGRRGGYGHGFGHRCDAENGVALHREVGVDVAVAELVDLQHLAGAPNERDRARQQARLYRFADGGLVGVELHRRQRTQGRNGVLPLP